MSGFVAPEIPANRMAGEVGFDIPATFGEGFAATLAETWATNPVVGHLRRSFERGLYYDESFAVGPGERMTMPAVPSKILSAADANERYGLKGHLAFDDNTPEPVAASLRKRKDEELANKDLMRRADVGIGTALTAGILGSAPDPLNVLVSFVPVIGQTRYAAMATRMGVPAARAAKGAAEGFVGAAAIEPLVWAGAQQEQADYTAVDSLMNLLVGSGVGAGLHLGVGHINDRLAAREAATPLQRAIDDLPVQEQLNLVRTVVADIEAGRTVDVAPMLDVAAARAGAMLDPPVAQDRAADIEALPDAQAYRGRPMTPEEEFARNQDVVRNLEADVAARARRGEPMSDADIARQARALRDVEASIVNRTREPMAEELRPGQQAARAAEAREPVPMAPADRAVEIEAEIAEMERFVPDGERDAINKASEPALKYASTVEKALKLAATCRMRRA